MNTVIGVILNGWLWIGILLGSGAFWITQGIKRIGDWRGGSAIRMLIGAVLFGIGAALTVAAVWL